ncbi:Trichodiene synthase [Mycena sanguinolenta]|uniref:Trichodiene synthase n=1 Tax=Mycena sanguinolenta TaxID=230812 RepID=A0A8H7DG32_9AGAR|nr:Trichodiene synthase [Mycena sanguinolenta]
MSGKEFPTQYFLGILVHLLDTVQHKNVSYMHEGWVKNLSYAYAQAAKHFVQLHVLEGLRNVKPKKLEAALQTITGMVVYCWLMASLTIHYTYTLLLDDSDGDPEPMMRNFFGDMMAGRSSSTRGGSSSMSTSPTTIDFFEGCWIEQYAFHGYKGSEDYPDFLWRMNGLGHTVRASIWPAVQFNEWQLFREITTAVAMMENWMVWVNDLISYYKEFNNPQDQTSLVNNYCRVSDLSLSEGLEKLMANTLCITEQIVAVFANKDPAVTQTLTKFMHGYITWHLCDKRYHMSEMLEHAHEDDPVGTCFHQYFAAANDVGRINPVEWTEPSFLGMYQQQQQCEAEEIATNEGSYYGFLSLSSWLPSLNLNRVLAFGEAH